MKAPFFEATLPELPIVGFLKLKSLDGKSLHSIEVTHAQKAPKLDPFFQHCFHELHQYLTGHSRNIHIELDLSGMKPFQREVLKHMKKIPYGKVATYKDLSLKMDSKAYQAIGSACGKNPLMLIYPCHRVLGSGHFGGFAHGLQMKKELLLLEKAPIEKYLS